MEKSKPRERKFIQAEVVPLEEAATPDLLNTNKHTARGRGNVENSMRRRGVFRPIAAAGKGAKVPVIGAGNQAFEIAGEIGIREAIVVHTRGDQIIINVRDDVAPGSAEFHALAIEDNATADFNPDVDLIAQLAAQDSGVLAALKKEDDTLDSMIGEILEGEGFIDHEKLKEEKNEISPRNLFHILISANVDMVDSLLEIQDAIHPLEKLPGVEILYSGN